MNTNIPPSITTPDKVETRIGTLKFTDGFVTLATPLTVDAEGFIHDLATTDDHVFWVAFEEVEEVIAKGTNE